MNKKNEHINNKGDIEESLYIVKGETLQYLSTGGLYSRTSIRFQILKNQILGVNAVFK